VYFFNNFFSKWCFIFFYSIISFKCLNMLKLEISLNEKMYLAPVCLYITDSVCNHNNLIKNMMLDLWDDHTFYTYLYLIIYYFYTCYSQYIVMYKYVSLLICHWSLNIFRPYINLYIEIENLYFVSNCVTKLLFILLNCSWKPCVCLFIFNLL